MNVDRPTGNPNIESGAGLFAQLVKEEGSHVGGPAKEPEGVCRGGREEGEGYGKIWWVSKVRCLRHEMPVRQASAHPAGAHFWATCFRKEVPELLAHLFSLNNQRKTPRGFMCWSR